MDAILNEISILREGAPLIIDYKNSNMVLWQIVDKF